MDSLELTVSEFVALINQTLEFAYPRVTVVGELSNFRINKNKWVYFNLKDDYSIVSFFGSVYNLPGPLKDGLLLKVMARPYVHPKYGFSLVVEKMEPTGEGSIKQAIDLLKAKLDKEGIFAEERKRQLLYPPEKVALITSVESAAYSDFTKTLNDRWAGLEIRVQDVMVQGDLAVEQIIRAIDSFNLKANHYEVLVLTRGGGSIEDLQIFNNENLTRAVAASRIPTVVAIGHERDTSLAELAADKRASTPTAAAELLVPNKKQVIEQLKIKKQHINESLKRKLEIANDQIKDYNLDLTGLLNRVLVRAKDQVLSAQHLLTALNPNIVLQKGYVLMRKEGVIIRSSQDVSTGDIVGLTLYDGIAQSIIKKVTKSGDINGQKISKKL